MNEQRTCLSIEKAEKMFKDILETMRKHGRPVVIDWTNKTIEVTTGQYTRLPVKMLSDGCMECANYLFLYHP